MEEIIKDLLNKIDVQNKIIADQSAFIMKMATYHDEREDKLAELRDDRLLKFFHFADASGILKRFLDSKFIKSDPSNEATETEDEAMH